MVSPSKIARSSLPPLVRRKILGSGQGGRQVSSRSMARGDSTSMPWAASPPSTFCQEGDDIELGEVEPLGKGGGGGVADGEALAAGGIQAASGTLTPRWCRSR